MYIVAALFLICLPLQAQTNNLQQLIGSGNKLPKNTPGEQQLVQAIGEAIKANPAKASELAAQATSMRPASAAFIAESAIAATVATNQSAATLKSVLKSVFANSVSVASPELAAKISFHAAKGVVSASSNATKEHLQAITAQSISSILSWSSEANFNASTVLVTVVAEIVRGTGSSAAALAPAVVQAAVYAIASQQSAGGVSQGSVQQVMSFDAESFVGAVSKELGLQGIQATQLQSVASEAKEMAIRAIAGSVQTASISTSIANQNAVVPGAVTPVLEQ